MLVQSCLCRMSKPVLTFLGIDMCAIHVFCAYVSIRLCCSTGSESITHAKDCPTGLSHKALQALSQPATFPQNVFASFFMYIQKYHRLLERGVTPGTMALNIGLCMILPSLHHMLQETGPAAKSHNGVDHAHAAFGRSTKTKKTRQTSSMHNMNRQC